MATNPTAGISDPAILRKTEAQLAQAAIIANGKPTVTGSELILPSTTVRTTSNTVIATTSANNDPGDTVTVYAAPQGGLYVNAIDQTIINNPVTGVSSIVAGNGIAITASRANGTGTVIINATAASVGNIAVLNLDGNASNVLHGDGTWSADTTTYGNSNVVSLLSSFGSNTITTTGNVSVGNIIGNGQSLTGLAGANVSGEVGYAAVANSVAVANVTGIGNIATTNLDGSSSNVLYGNGVFAPASGGGDLGNLEVTGTTISIANGASETSIIVGNGPSGLTMNQDSNNPAYLKLSANTTDSSFFDEGFGYTGGSYTSDGGSGGTITLTSATDVELFLNNLNFPGTIVSLEINGTDTVPYTGASYGGGTVQLSTSTPPSVDPTVVASIRFNIVYENQFLIDDDNNNFGIYVGDLNFDIESVRDINITAGDDLRLVSNDVFSLTNNDGGIDFTANSNGTAQYWEFETTGQTLFPVLTTARGDTSGGTLTGPTLRMATPGYQELVITTPDGDDAISDSQRLVINPGKGADNTSGEGGDIYLWAGRGGSGVDGDVSAGSGGDVKIRGGYSPLDADGGYIRVEGGEAFRDGTGGFVEIYGGQSGNAIGGALLFAGGQGGSNGGHANISGGLGLTQSGGNVNIIGGVSGNSSNEHGNINLTSSASSWVFGNDGNLTLPSNTFAVNYANGSQVPLGGGNTGNLSFDQSAITSDQSNAYINLDAFSAGDLDIGTNDAKNVVIRTDASTANLAWTFDSTGNLTLPGSLQLAGGTGVVESSANNVSIYSDSGQLNGLTMYGDGSGNDGIEIYGNTAVSIFTDYSNTAYQTTFQQDGNIVTAGSILPGTANTFDLGNTTNRFNNAYFSGNIVAGAVTASGKIGYANGGTATQSGTGQSVTLNQLTGQITLAKSSWIAGDIEVFNVICNKVDTYDYVMAQAINGSESSFFNVVAFPYVPLANTFQIQVQAIGVATSAPLIQFFIMKAAIA